MSTLDSIIKDINKKYKYNMINIGGIDEYNLKLLPFSSPRLNYMLYGGIPLGRIIEFSGDEGSGKTTTALDLVKQAQKYFTDKKAVYMDCERTFDAYWANLLGVDVKNLILIQPETETAEQLFDIALEMMNSGEISIFVVDSLGVMVSSQAYQKTMEEKTYGGISQPLTLFSKKAIPICARTDCILVCINQMRDDMNSMFGGSITTGGRAFRHNCSCRLQFRKGNFIDTFGNKVSRATENPAGNIVECALIKSKVCKADRKVGFYTLKYLDGIDYISDLIDVAIKENYIYQGGAWYTLLDDDGEILEIDNKQLKFQGKSSLYDYLISNKDIYDKLNNKVCKKII